MAQIVIPAEYRARFEVSEATAVQDEKGNVLGYYMPACKATEADYEWLMNDVTKEEIEYSLRSGPGRPLSEILTELREISSK